jgi:hypothetical protein
MTDDQPNLRPDGRRDRRLERLKTALGNCCIPATLAPLIKLLPNLPHKMAANAIEEITEAIAELHKLKIRLAPYADANGEAAHAGNDVDAGAEVPPRTHCENAEAAPLEQATEPASGADGSADAEPRQYLDLPPLIRTKYEQRLAHCRRAWEVTQDPLAVSQATSWTFHYRQPIEPWLEEAVVALAVKVRTPAQAKRHRDGIEDVDRYIFVRDAVASGMTWEDAKQAAAEQLGVSDEAIAKSYKRVKRRFRELHPSRYQYLTLADVRYRALG